MPQLLQTECLSLLSLSSRQFSVQQQQLSFLELWQKRTKFISYCIYSAIISLLVYPIEAHWIWGGGWLADLGFHDFAGSTCVHMAGGVAAFVGAAILGPRIGKYDKNGKAKAIPGHSLYTGRTWLLLSFGSAGSDSMVRQQLQWKATLSRLQVRFS